MNGNPLPPKKEVALALLERGSVHVHLDPRSTGVIVPAWFKRQPQLVLQVGLNMRPTPIPDLRVEDDRMSCTLSFNRSPFLCILPWACVYAMVGDDGRGMIWPEDVPPEVALQGRSQADAAAKKATPERALAVVKPAAEATSKKPKRAAKVRPEGAAHVAVVKEKKPRAKKPRPDAPAEASHLRSDVEAPATAPEQGVLLAIPPPGAAAKPAKPTAVPAPRPAPVPAPVATITAPAPSPQPQKLPMNRPGASKPKREIPPYLRVVK